MKSILFGCGTRDVTASVGMLSLRLTFGLLMLFGHGLPKLKKFDAIIENKTFYTPDFFPLSWMNLQVSLGAAIAAELGAAALIIIGLGTRWAAFILGFTMVVAAFAHLNEAAWIYQVGSTKPFKELALLYLAAMIGIILAGPGRYSLDAVLDKPRKGGRMKISL